MKRKDKIKRRDHDNIRSHHILKLLSMQTKKQYNDLTLSSRYTAEVNPTEQLQTVTCHLVLVRHDVTWHMVQLLRLTCKL